ncbi:MAG: hypothetical protein WCC10_02380 [Tumebacillaceae bacterium]
MPNQQSEQGKQGQSGGAKFPTTLPKAMEKRLSMKWLTMQALSDVIERLNAHQEEPRVVLLTAWGQIEGYLREIQPSYAEAFREADGHLDPDLASMVTHVRSDMLKRFEKEEKELQLVDNAPILSLTNVVLIQAGSERTLPQLTLFADQVIGFTLSSLPQLH